MRGYIEIIARKKAHELILLVYSIISSNNLKGKGVENLKGSVNNLAVELFKAREKLFDDEKIKHINKSRGYLYEAKYYLDLFWKLNKINRSSRKQLSEKVDLLDKLLVSMIKNKKHIL